MSRYSLGRADSDDEITQPSSTTNTALVKWGSTDGETISDTGILIDSDNNMSGHGTEVTSIGATETAYTLLAADAGKVVEISSTDNLTLTLPQHSTTDLPLGFQCAVTQIGTTAVITVAKQGSDTLQSSGSKVKLTGNFSAATVYKRIRTTTVGTWLLLGDLA
jgi:hypothetical protein